MPKHIKSYWWQILLLILGVALSVNANLRLPDLMAGIIDRGIAQSDTAYIWSQGIQMLLVTLIGGLGMIAAGFFAARIGTGLARRIREDIFTHILAFSVDEIDQFSTASLITRTTNDVNQLQNTIAMALRFSTMAPLMAFGAISMALATAPSMTWIIGLIVAILFAIMTVLLIFGLPKFQLIQKLNDRLNLVTRENLTGIRVVRAFNNEKYEEQKFEDVNNSVTKTNVFVNRLMVTLMPLVQFVMSASTLLIIWIGAALIDHHEIEIGSVMAFVQYTIQIMMSFMFLTMTFFILPRAIISYKRIIAVTKTPLTITFPPTTASPPTAPLSLTFKNVSFSYAKADAPDLKNISFTALPGQTTAIIGSTGSGKSTLINLIPRLHDPSSGEILISDQNIKTFSENDLMQKISLCPQKAVLFTGTIESNIKLGAPHISDQDMRAAAKIAQASEFIAKLPSAYQSKVSQGGTNFSGGQKQRLAIARAIAKRPEIYLFDDSFSALDYQTDLNLRTALHSITKSSILVIVAQRISTIKQAHQILVINEGKIVGQGTHHELLRSCRTYREIAASQLSESEMKQEIKNAHE
jgi:ATP-binding cassette subfamily B protein